MATTVASLMMSCSKGEDVAGNGSIDNGQSAVKVAFASQYPTATNVSWNTVQSYNVASFNATMKGKSDTAHHSCSAWYTNNGKRVLSKVEFTYDQLPDVLKSGYVASAYGDGTWTIAHILQIVKADSSIIFKFKVTKSGENAHILYFNAAGTLLKDKEISDEYFDCDDYPATLPTELQTYITATYPAAVVDEVMHGKWGYWVVLQDGTIDRSLFFSNTYELLMSVAKMALTDTPKPVQDAFAASTYASWTVKSVEYFMWKGGDPLYIVKVKSTRKHATLIYKADGTSVMQSSCGYPF